MSFSASGAAAVGSSQQASWKKCSGARGDSGLIIRAIMSTPGQAPAPATAAAPSKSNSHIILILIAGAVAAVLVITVAGFALLRAMNRHRLPDAGEMPQIMKEAMGVAPVPAEDTAPRKAIRDAYRNLLEEGKAYTEETQRRMHTPAMASLMTPASFVDPDLRDKVIEELRGLHELDARHLEAVEQFPAMMTRNLAAAGLSESDLKDFETGTKQGMSETMGPLRKATELEMKWLDGEIEVYQYALDNRAAMGISEASEFVITNDDVRERFNQLVANAGELQKKAIEASDAFQKGQQQRQQELGISGSDVGKSPK